MLSATASAFSYIPTLESLLRNGNNSDVKKSSLFAQIRIIESKLAENSSLIKSNQALKYYVYNDNEYSPKLVQLEYAANSFKSENLYQQKLIPFKNLESTLKNSEKIEQRLYYSVLAMLLNNKGSFMMDFLKDLGFKLTKNKDLINVKKRNLLRSYKNYLKTEPENMNENNPLRPKAEEALKRVRKIYNSPLISEDGIVKRFKNGDHFSWLVEQEGLYISFNHNHHLEELTFETSAGKFSVIFGRYLLQGAAMEFPEKVTFKLPNEKEFYLELVSLKKFSDSAKAFSKRMRDYSKQIKKNNISVTSERSFLTL